MCLNNNNIFTYFTKGDYKMNFIRHVCTLNFYRTLSQVKFNES